MDTEQAANQGSIEQDLSPFRDLAGDDVATLIVERAPRKVMSRVLKALDHYTKAHRLMGVDDEMGAVRCIAAEEELVVGIFEFLKLQAALMPEHGDFIKKYKNHYVKLAFSPVLMQLRYILTDLLEKQHAPVGFEGHLHWEGSVVVAGSQVKVRLADDNGKELIRVNPLAFAISLDCKSDEEVADSIFEQLRDDIQTQKNMTVREYITARAEFRNKLLYAEDAGFAVMGETLEKLIATAFAPTLRDLLWSLAILLSDKPTRKDFGLVSQFIAIYRRVLTSAKLV